MKHIPVFYTPKQSLDKVISFSKSPNKPKLLANFWKKQKLPVMFFDVEPITVDFYKSVHDPEYIDGLFAGRIANGFGNTDREVLATLPHLTGSVVDAGKCVLSTANRIAFSLSSGSHHASYGSNHGFCTVNHNMAALSYLKNEFGLKKVGIIDVDAHHPNGDFDIKNQLKFDWLKIYSFANDQVSSSNAAKWLQRFHQTCLEFEGHDLVLVNAGVDSHLADPLGGILTTMQLQQRDSIIFETLKLLNIPSIVTLAGAYQSTSAGSIQPALDLHTNTLKEILRIYQIK